jgi:hypothetical protein
VNITPPKIPAEILAPIIQKITNELKQTVENWDEYQYERVKAELGPNWAHIPNADIRRQGGNLRRSGKVGPVGGGHGPGVSTGPPKEYRAYLQSKEWQAIAISCKAFYGFRCAICYVRPSDDNPLQAHHRTYERVPGRELPTDCIAVCKRCHKVCDVRRRREAKLPRNPELFDGAEQ